VNGFVFLDDSGFVFGGLERHCAVIVNVQLLHDTGFGVGVDYSCIQV
jgi:hypothetical protein